MAAPIYHSTTTATGTAASTTTVFSHTVPNVADRLLLVSVAHRTNGTVSSVKFGTDEFSLLTTAGFGATPHKPKFEIWYLQGPTVGTDNITVTHSTGALVGDYVVINATNIYNADQIEDPYVEIQTGTGSSGSFSLDIQGHGLVYGGISTSGGTANVSQEPFQIALWEATSDGNWTGAGAYRNTASSVSIGFTTTQDWAGVVVSILGSTPIYSAPVFDRTQTDVDNKTAKGYFNATDWYRIFENSFVARDLIFANEGETFVFDYLGYVRRQDTPQKSQLNRLIENVRQCVELVSPDYSGGFHRMRTWGEGNVNSIKFTDLNDIEENLSLIFALYSYP
jgi:hypothetical protein